MSKESMSTPSETEREEAFSLALAAYRKTREDLETPHECHAAYTLSNFGTELDAIEPFTEELTGIVDTMKEQLATEARILEGTDAPEYKPIGENELSEGETKEDQWTIDLRNGFSTIVLTPIFRGVSSSSSSTARPCSPVSPTLASAGTCCPRPSACCKETLDVSGCVTDAMNECSECTVPTISEPMLGTPSEVK